MNARTDTQCTYCTHHKVCGKLNRPINIVEAITEFNPVDDNGIDIIVRCMDFEKKVASPRTDHDFGFDC